MKSGRYLLSALLLALLPPFALAVQEPASLLPDGARGWERRGIDGDYGPDTLFDLIDGGAEVYRAFNVLRVVSRRYVHADRADIVVDIFDMGSPRDAFGAYHFDMREGEEAGIGAESELVGSSLAFWKGPFFVSLTPLDDDPVIRDAVLSLGRKIAAAAAEDAPPPALLSFLPPKGLVESQVHYFHDERILGLLLPLDGKAVPGLSDRTEGIVARYRPGTSDSSLSTLLLIVYPTEGDARKAGKALRGMGQGETETRVSGRRLIAVFGAGSRDEARRLVDEAAALTQKGGPSEGEK